MSDHGAAQDQSRDEARAKSRGCPYCSGEGTCQVFDPGFDGRRVVLRDVAMRGELKRAMYAMVIGAHCICPMGEWVRSKSERDILDRIPDLADVLAGRSRYQAQDPTGEGPSPWYAGQPARGGGVQRV